MQKRDIVGRAGAYGLWAIAVAIAIVLLLVSRQTLGIVLEIAGSSDAMRALLDRVYLLFAAIAVIIVIVFTEHYFRTGHDKGVLLKRSSRVIGIELLVLMALHTIPQVVVGGYGGWAQRAVILVEGVAGFALLAVSLRTSRARK